MKIALGALLAARLDELADLLELHLRVDRADVRVLVERVAEAQRLHAVAAACATSGSCDRLLHEETRARAADVALVEVDAVDDPLDRLVERRVVEDDVRRLAAELERRGASSCPRASRWIRLPTSVEPVKATLFDVGVMRERARPSSPAPVTMLTTPGGSSAWLR